MKYDFGGSESSIYEVNLALKSYGYSTDGVKKYDNIIITSINNFRSVIMRGDDHSGKGGP